MISRNVAPLFLILSLVSRVRAENGASVFANSLEELERSRIIGRRSPLSVLTLRKGKSFSGFSLPASRVIRTPSSSFCGELCLDDDACHAVEMRFLPQVVNPCECQIYGESLKDVVDKIGGAEVVRIIILYFPGAIVHACD